jgi:hypothetical protein
MQTTTEINLISLIGMLVGWAFTLGIMWQLGRNHGNRLDRHDEQFKEMNNRIDKHHESLEMHTSSEWRAEIRAWMEKLDRRIEEFQHQCMERIKGGDCK